MPLTESVAQQTGVMVQLEPVYNTNNENVKSRLSVRRKVTDKIAAEFSTQIGAQPSSSLILEYDISPSVILRGTIGDPRYIEEDAPHDPTRHIGVDVRLKTEFD